MDDLDEQDKNNALRHHENFKPYIDKIDDLYGVELRLWSDGLKTGGSADIACKYEGLASIVDYKTKNKEQRVEYMVDYFLQSTAYAIMFKELSNIHIDQIVILCSYENKVQVFKSRPEPWVTLFIRRLVQFDYSSVKLT